MTERTSPHEAISAFIDNEPFDANELAAALSTADGREVLLDLIALRHVVAVDIAPESAAGVNAAKRLRWRPLAAAAAIVLALAGGYVLGQHVASGASASRTDVAPAPTKVIELKPGIDWHITNKGH